MSNSSSTNPSRPTLLMYGLDWHLHHSDAVAEVLIRPLAPWLDIKFVAWDGTHPPPLPPADQPVCFLQGEPPVKDPNWRHRPLVWIPMWDHSATWHTDPAWWQALPAAWRIVALSKSVDDLAQKAGGRAVFSARFHRDPNTMDEVDWVGPSTLYYWNRVGLAGPKFLHRLCQTLEIECLLFRPNMDPGIPTARAYDLPAKLGAARVEQVPFHANKTDYLAQVNRANFLLAPRPLEGIGVVMLDALARGCGVLAANCSTASEYIRSGETGMLLPCTDRSTASGKDEHVAWWTQGDGFLLSDDQDWDGIGRMDWPAFGARAREDATSAARKWHDALPGLAQFLMEAPDVVAVAHGRSPFVSVTQSPRISIVTPSFNQAPFLEQTMRSILDQNYPNLEYIVIDGGSTDGSVDIIRRYAGRLAYWCSEPDKGQYDAINKGFARSTGHIMTWLNSDDMYFPWTLKVVAEVFSSFQHVQWISSLFPVSWNENGEPYFVRIRPGFSDLFFKKGYYTSPRHYFRHCIQQESTFWTRPLWDAAGGRLDTTYKLAADFDLWARFFSKAPLVGVQSMLGGFRHHGNQRSLLQEESYFDETEQIFQKAGGRHCRGCGAWIRSAGLSDQWPLNIL
ncbi:MAG: glycosyltransferase, partial [bacterium]